MLFSYLYSFYESKEDDNKPEAPDIKNLTEKM